MGPYKSLRTWVDEFIPKKYGNFMGVDRPDRTYEMLQAMATRKASLGRGNPSKSAPVQDGPLLVIDDEWSCGAPVNCLING